MPDRVIRDEILESDRWLDLPTDAARLAFVGFLLICDDFGNFEGGARRLFRFLNKFTQIKSEEAAVIAIDSLMACDLIRRYQDGDRELFHIPRFKSHRQYLSRRYPRSPWCKPDSALGKTKRIYNQGLAKNVVTKSLPRSMHVAEGVGVGVGVGVNLKTTSRTKASAQAPFELPEWITKEHWQAWIDARKKMRKAPTDYAMRLAVRKLDNLRQQGESPDQVLMQSAFNGWVDLYPQKEGKR